MTPPRTRTHSNAAITNTSTRKGTNTRWRILRSLLPLLCVLHVAAARSPLHIVAPPLNDDARFRMLSGARELLTAADPSQVKLSLPDTRIAGTRVVVVSLSREKATALVGAGMESTLEAALRGASQGVSRQASAAEIAAGRIKIDIVLERGPEMRFDRLGRAKLDRSLQGLWLSAEGLLFLPEELSAQNLISKDGELQIQSIASYLKQSRSAELEGNPGRPGTTYCTVKYDSFMEGSSPKLVRLYRGNATPSLNPDALLHACVEGGNYLVRHQHTGGLFDYLYEPSSNELIAEYNEVRHAGTAYSLLELYATTKDEKYRTAAERAIDVMLRWIRIPDGKDFETIVYEGGEAKLGGAALAVLAILKHHEITGEPKWMDHASKLARFLLFQQQKDGRFESKYFFDKPPDDDPFESIYYPGEAILALTRMQSSDPDHPVWREAAFRGVDWLMKVRDAGKTTYELTHDHWLLIGLNELYPMTQNKEHLAHVERIAEAILQAQHKAAVLPDWIGSFYEPPRSTPTATRAEAMVAMWRLSGVTGHKRKAYLEALKKMAEFQMRCQITESSAMYLPRPDVAAGGFRRGLDDWEVRIDYIQHSISSLLGLRTILTGS